MTIAGSPRGNNRSEQLAGDEAVIFGVREQVAGSTAAKGSGLQNLVVDFMSWFGRAPEPGQQRNENSCRTYSLDVFIFLALVVFLASFLLLVAESSPLRMSTLLVPSGPTLTPFQEQPVSVLLDGKAVNYKELTSESSSIMESVTGSIKQSTGDAEAETIKLSGTKSAVESVSKADVENLPGSTIEFGNSGTVPPISDLSLNSGSLDSVIKPSEDVATGSVSAPLDLVMESVNISNPQNKTQPGIEPVLLPVPLNSTDPRTESVEPAMNPLLSPTHPEPLEDSSSLIQSDPATNAQTESVTTLQPEPVSEPAESPTLVMYELFYSEAAHEHLHQTPPYRPLSVHPGMARPNSSDIDGPDLLPIIQDTVYQGLICEYGGILAVANHLEELQGATPWVAFISWRAFQKFSELNDELMAKLTEQMKTNLAGKGGGAGGDPLAGTAGTNVIYTWAYWGPSDMYGYCDKWHDTCSLIFSATLERMFANNGTQPMTAVDPKTLTLNVSFLPELPDHPTYMWSLMSYWALHRDLFLEYVDFARMFLVTLESIWDLHGNVDRCPLTLRDPSGYTNRLCWCFIMERLINIWAYHRGLHWVWLKVATGDLITQYPLSERPRLMAKYFAKKNMERFVKGFPSRLSPDQVDFYRKLGGRV